MLGIGWEKKYAMEKERESGLRDVPDLWVLGKGLRKGKGDGQRERYANLAPFHTSFFRFSTFFEL